MDSRKVWNANENPSQIEASLLSRTAITYTILIRIFRSFPYKSINIIMDSC